MFLFVQFSSFIKVKHKYIMNVSLFLFHNIDWRLYYCSCYGKKSLWEAGKWKYRNHSSISPSWSETQTEQCIKNNSTKAKNLKLNWLERFKISIIFFLKVTIQKIIHSIDFIFLKVPIIKHHETIAMYFKTKHKVYQQTKKKKLKIEND